MQGTSSGQNDPPPQGVHFTVPRTSDSEVKMPRGIQVARGTAIPNPMALRWETTLAYWRGQQGLWNVVKAGRAKSRKDGKSDTRREVCSLGTQPTAAGFAHGEGAVRGRRRPQEAKG